jgi:hypothetical protein
MQNIAAKYSRTQHKEAESNAMQ